MEIAIVNRKLVSKVIEYMDENFNYDMTQLSDIDRKYLIEVIYSTVKFVNDETIQD